MNVHELRTLVAEAVDASAEVALSKSAYARLVDGDAHPMALERAYSRMLWAQDQYKLCESQIIDVVLEQALANGATELGTTSGYVLKVVKAPEKEQ